MYKVSTVGNIESLVGLVLGLTHSRLVRHGLAMAMRLSFIVSCPPAGQAGSFICWLIRFSREEEESHEVSQGLGSEMAH